MQTKIKNVHAQALGRLGGKAGRGACKARSSDQARAAVMVRWSKRVDKQWQKREASTIPVPMHTGTCSACGKVGVEIDHFGICQNCG